MGLAVSLLKSKCLHGFIPFRRLQRRICFLAFSSFYRWPAFLGSWPLLSIFQASNGVLSLSHAASLPPPLLPLSSTIKDPLVTVGPLGYSSYPKFSLIATLIPLCHVKQDILTFPGLGGEHLWGRSLFCQPQERNREMRMKANSLSCFLNFSNSLWPEKVSLKIS